jgi:hypothetical protein
MPLNLASSFYEHDLIIHAISLEVTVFSFNNRQSKSSPSKPAIKATMPRQKDALENRKFDNTYFKFVCLTVSFTMTSMLLNSIIGTQPVAQVGDMLGFYSNTASVTAPITAVPARVVAGPGASPGHPCTLDVSVMTKPGGAMTVMAVRPDGVVLSWAGGATASKQAGCQGNVQLLVANAGYQRLQMALTHGGDKLPIYK